MDLVAVGVSLLSDDFGRSTTGRFLVAGKIILPEGLKGLLAELFEEGSNERGPQEFFAELEGVVIEDALVDFDHFGGGKLSQGRDDFFIRALGGEEEQDHGGELLRLRVQLREAVDASNILRNLFDEAAV